MRNIFDLYINPFVLKRFVLLLFFGFVYHFSFAQKIDSISFHLYTDSLKKGFYNYINVDGKLANGNWLPLTPKDILLTANTGNFRDNDLFIDSSYTGETVTVKAVLKSNPTIWKEVTIYIRKRPFGPLPTEQQVLDEMRQEQKKPKKHYSLL